MIVEGLDKITFANGILRIAATKIGASGQEESSGTLEIPAGSIENVLNGIANAVNEISEKTKEAQENTNGGADKGKKKDK